MKIENPKQPAHLAVVEAQNLAESVSQAFQVAQPAMVTSLTEKGVLQVVFRYIYEDKNKSAAQWYAFLAHMTAIGLTGIAVITMVLRID